jgi:phage gp29-like protein
MGDASPTPAAAPPTAPIAVPAPFWDRDAAMLGNSLTPARLTAILLERNQGYLQPWVDLADEAREKYPHLHSQLAIREESVVETAFLVKPGAGSNKRAARKAADAVRELFATWRARPGEGWDVWLAEMVSAVYYGRHVHEVLWERLEGETRPVALAKVDPRRLSYACGANDADPWALRLWDATDPRSPFGKLYGAKFSEFHPDKFLVTAPRVRGAQPPREGLFAVLVWWWLFLIWDWRDVMALVEMIGRPPVIGYFSAGGAKGDGALEKFNGNRAATDVEVRALSKATKAVSGALRAVLADTVRLQTLDYKLPGGETPLQLAVAKVIDAYTSKAINGVDSISDLKPGARASVEVQERATATYWRADCRRVERLLTWLAGRYIAANPARFGATCPLPVIEAQTAPPKDVKANGERIQVAQAIGLKVKRAQAYAELELEEPQEGDEVLEPPAPKVVAPPPQAPADGTTRDPVQTDTPPAKPAKE